jgi:sugar-specific transcriptional regulator TrmB
MNTKAIAWITGTLTLLLALFSFTLSFNALADLAAQHNISLPYLFPLVVEAGVIIFSLNALHRSLHGEHVRWQWLLIIGSSLIAGTFNVLHADANLIARIMAAMPSLFLLLSFESFLSQIKRGVQRTGLVQSVAQLQTELTHKQTELDTLIAEKEQAFNTLVSTKQAEVKQLAEQSAALIEAIKQAQLTLEQLQSEIDQANVQVDIESIEQRRQVLAQILATEGDLGASALATRLNISRGTVYNDLNALKQAGVIQKNGQGWEVIQ